MLWGECTTLVYEFLKFCFFSSSQMMIAYDLCPYKRNVMLKLLQSFIFIKDSFGAVYIATLASYCYDSDVLANFMYAHDQVKISAEPCGRFGLSPDDSLPLLDFYELIRKNCRDALDALHREYYQSMLEKSFQKHCKQRNTKSTTLAPPKESSVLHVKVIESKINRSNRIEYWSFSSTWKVVIKCLDKYFYQLSKRCESNPNLIFSGRPSQSILEWYCTDGPLNSSESSKVSFLFSILKALLIIVSCLKI